jgi:hypothetical protein
MAIEALISEQNQNFDHRPHHDLESILNVILVICTFTKGPNIPRPDFETPETLNMKTWFSTEPLKLIGFRKIAHFCRPEHLIIPGFTEYWEDFGPFALELIQLCFPSNPSRANRLTHQGMIAILDKAYTTVKESPTTVKVPPTNMKNLKRDDPLADDPPVPKKRMKRKLGKV